MPGQRRAPTRKVPATTKGIRLYPPPPQGFDPLTASKRELILHASPMIGPTRKSLVHVLRFRAPAEPGIYPYVCTFPGHWMVMNGEMVVK